MRTSISNILSADIQHVVRINAAQTTAQITGDLGANNSQNLYVFVFNSTTGRGEIWFDSDWNDLGSRVKIATLDNITTLADLNQITASDIVAYNNPQADPPPPPRDASAETPGNPPGPNDSDVTVNENALDTTALPDGSDLAVGTVTGSLPGSAAETATNQLNGSGGTAPLTYALVSGGNAATAGTFGTIQVNADGSYVYTLTKPFDTSPDADNGANTEVAESFQYRVTDTAGNSTTGTITVNIVDDVPTAQVDVNAAASGQTVTGNVEANDTAGADGIASIAWAGAVGNTVTLAHGVLTFDATGGYSYHANPNTSGTDVFDYTITDGDGDTASGNLGITVTSPGGASAPPVLDLDANNSNGGGSDYTSTFTIGGSAIPIADIDVNDHRPRQHDHGLGDDQHDRKRSGPAAE